MFRNYFYYLCDIKVCFVSRIKILNIIYSRTKLHAYSSFLQYNNLIKTNKSEISLCCTLFKHLPVQPTTQQESYDFKFIINLVRFWWCIVCSDLPVEHLPFLQNTLCKTLCEQMSDGCITCEQKWSETLILISDVLTVSTNISIKDSRNYVNKNY